MRTYRVMILHFDVSNAKHGEWSDAMYTPGLSTPEKYIKIWEGDITLSKDDGTILDVVWAVSQNNDKGSWRGNLTGWGLIDGCRSSAVGDVFCIDGDWWKVAPAGFEKIADTRRWNGEKFVGHTLQWQADDFTKHFPYDGKFQVNSKEEVDRAIAEYMNR